MDIPIQIVTIMMGLPIICIQGSPEDFRNKFVLQSLKVAFIIVNSADPDEMQITKLPFEGFPVYKRFIPQFQMSSSKFYHWGQKWPVQWVKCLGLLGKA